MVNNTFTLYLYNSLNAIVFRKVSLAQFLLFKNICENISRLKLELERYQREKWTFL